MSGFAKSKGEGSTNVRMSNTINLISNVNSGKVRHITLDPMSAPKIITNVENHRQYKPYYRVQFRIYPEDSSIDITPDPSKPNSLISHNIAFECKSLNPNWILAKTEEEETQGRVKSAVCLLYPRSGSLNEVFTK